MTRRAIDRFFKGFEGGTRKAERCNGKVRNPRIRREDRRLKTGAGGQAEAAGDAVGIVRGEAR